MLLLCSGILATLQLLGPPRWFIGKESACQSRRCKRHVFDPWVGKVPWSRKWQPTPIFLPGKSLGQRSLVGYSPRGHKESDMTEWAQIHMQLLRRIIYTVKGTINKRKKKPSEWEKILANDLCHKGLILKYIKNSCSLIFLKRKQVK